MVGRRQAVRHRILIPASAGSNPAGPVFRRRISEEYFFTWWVWRSWLARQIVALEAVGSSPTIHPLSSFISTSVCSSAG